MHWDASSSNVVPPPHPLPIPLLPLTPDPKAKARAVEAGVAVGLARALAARLPESHMISVRVRMLISDLLQVPDMQVRGERGDEGMIDACWSAAGILMRGEMMPA